MRVFTFLYYEYLNKEIQKDPEFTRRLHLFKVGTPADKITYPLKCQRGVFVSAETVTSSQTKQTSS